jgi:hypothetical protein
VIIRDTCQHFVLIVELKRDLKTGLDELIDVQVNSQT